MEKAMNQPNHPTTLKALSSIHRVHYIWPIGCIIRLCCCPNEASSDEQVLVLRCDGATLVTIGLVIRHPESFHHHLHWIRCSWEREKENVSVRTLSSFMCQQQPVHWNVLMIFLEIFHFQNFSSFAQPLFQILQQSTKTTAAPKENKLNPEA